MTARAAVVLLTVCAVSCGAPLVKLPAGPHTSIGVLDSANAYGDAIDACARPRTVAADVAVSGSVNGGRFRRRLRVGIAYDGYIGAQASARLEAIASAGPPLFILVSTGNDASLLLPRDSRVVKHGDPGALLDAVAGVPLDTVDLHSVLLGCASEPGEFGARAIGPDWIVLTKPQGPITRVLHLHREGTPAVWRTVAEQRLSGGTPLWRAEYGNFLGGFPRTIRLISADEGKRFNLTLAIAQLAFDVPVGANVLALQGADTAKPMTLEELRRSGPLGQSRD